MKYLCWNEKKINDFSEENITTLYNQGYLFTRLEKGLLQQTRSLRINLKKFQTSSENRRILRKGQDIKLEKNNIPYSDYHWRIGLLAKKFYAQKAKGAFSANKIKEIITANHNFNYLLKYKKDNLELGFAIVYENQFILHYSYPFYDLENAPQDMGLIMMIKAICDAQSRGLNYLYLGSLQRPTDTYKLQFNGLEWFDGKDWSDNIELAKKELKVTQ